MTGKTESKKQLADRVAKEQGLDAKDLFRLPIEELRKLDAKVADVDLLGSDPASEAETTTTPVATEVPTDVVPSGKTLIGNHPVTGKPVYQ